jgi:hypothetical protein
VQAGGGVLTPDPQDVPFLPIAGEVYRIRTIICQPPDKHDTRPVVVVASPFALTGRITFVTRTSQTESAGVPHPRNPVLDLSRDGVFSRLRSVEAQLWTPRNVTRLGVLEQSVFAAVIERFWT